MLGLCSSVHMIALLGYGPTLLGSYPTFAAGRSRSRSEPHYLWVDAWWSIGLGIVYVYIPRHGVDDDYVEMHQ